jgi:hypothetical protein
MTSKFPTDPKAFIEQVRRLYLARKKQKRIAPVEDRAGILRDLMDTETHCDIGNNTRKVSFARGLRPNFVVFCEANISADKMKAIKEYFRTKNAPGPLFVLTSGDHLNDDDAEYKVNQKAFDELEKTIKGIGKSVRVSGRQQR